MIVRPTPNLWELPFIWRLSILKRIAPQIVLVGVVSAAAVMALHRWPAFFRNFSVAPFTLLGIAISIFLGFRNSACYDRWWEARRQLGALVGEMRSLARWALALPGQRKRREDLVRCSIAYSYALMAHLRGDAMPEEVQRYAGFVPAERDIPSALLATMESQTAAMMVEGEFGEIALARFDERLSAFAAYQVACERIRSTPTPFTYTLLLHRTAYAFCLLLPFGLATTLGWATPVFGMLVAYAFFGLDALGDELQEPFGTEMNALPLYAMARTIEISLLEALGESNLPEPAQAIDGILH